MDITGARWGLQGAEAVPTLRALISNGDFDDYIVDTEDKIRAFLPQLDELVSEGLVIIDPVEVIRYVGRDAKERA